MNVPEERRRYKRIEKHFILNYYAQGDPHLRFAASQLKNISLGGMCLITSTPFAKMSMLNIELKTPFQSELTHLEGTVLASNERLKGIIYETHLEFVSLSDNARNILAQIVSHFDNQGSESHG